MSVEPMSYRDYLIWTASNTVHALSDAVAMALSMDEEMSAIELLEHRLRTVAELAAFANPNPERVAPRPDPEAVNDA